MAASSIDASLVGSAGSSGLESQGSVIGSGSGSGSGLGQRKLCYYECGPAYPIAQMYRANARAVWRCKACHAAERALQAACKTAGTSKALAMLKAEDIHQYKAKVRALRISSGAGDMGLADCGSRRASINKFVLQLKQAVGVREEETMQWMSFPQFVAWHVEKEGMSRESAEQLWTVRLADEAVEKRARGQTVLIGVLDMPRTIAFRERQFSAEVLRSSDIDSRQEADQAASFLGNVGAGRNNLEAAAFGGIGSALLETSTARSSSLTNPAAAPSAAAMFPPRCFEGETPKRTLAARLSEASDSGAVGAPKKRARAARGPAAGVTGELRDLRLSGQEAGKKIVEEFGRGKANMAKTVVAAYKQAQVSLPADVKTAVDKYLGLLEQCKRQQEGIASWTASSARDKLAEFTHLAEELEKVALELTNHRASFKKVRDEQKEALRKTRQQEVKRRQKECRDFAECPEPLLSYVYKCGGIVAMPKESLSGSVKVLGSGLTVTVEEDIGNAMDFGKPRTFRMASGSGGAAATLNTFQKSFGTTRVSESVQKFLAALNEHGNVDEMCISRKVPKGPPQDSIESLQWLPADWKAAQVNPSALRTMGVPWFQGAKAGNVRFGETAAVLEGIGGIMQVERGDHIFLLWPYSSVIEKGATIRGSNTFLFEEMGKRQFEQWADEHVKWTQLSAGDTLWVPYGWSVGVIVRPGGPGILLVQPFINHYLAVQCEVMPQVAEALSQFVEQESSADPRGPWPQIGAELLEWCERAVADIKAKRQTTEAVPMQALEDIGDEALPPLEDAAAAEEEADEDAQGSS